MNKINFLVNYSDRLSDRMILEVADNDVSADVYIKPDEMFDCLGDSIVDWNCLKSGQKQTLNEIVCQIITKMEEDKDV